MYTCALERFEGRKKRKRPSDAPDAYICTCAFLRLDEFLLLLLLYRLIYLKNINNRTTWKLKSDDKRERSYLKSGRIIFHRILYTHQPVMQTSSLYIYTPERQIYIQRYIERAYNSIYIRTRRYTLHSIPAHVEDAYIYIFLGGAIYIHTHTLSAWSDCPLVSRRERLGSLNFRSRLEQWVVARLLRGVHNVDLLKFRKGLSCLRSIRFFH